MSALVRGDLQTAALPGVLPSVLLGAVLAGFVLLMTATAHLVYRERAQPRHRLRRSPRQWRIRDLMTWRNR